MCPVLSTKAPSWCERVPWLQWWQLPLLPSPGFCWLPSQACLLGGLAGQCCSLWLLCTVSLRYFSHSPSPQTSAMPAKSQLTSCMRTSHSSCLFPWFPASMQRQLWHILLIPSLILPLSFQISSQPHFLGCAGSEIHMQTRKETLPLALLA